MCRLHADQTQWACFFLRFSNARKENTNAMIEAPVAMVTNKTAMNENKYEPNCECGQSAPMETETMNRRGRRTARRPYNIRIFIEWCRGAWDERKQIATRQIQLDILQHSPHKSSFTMFSCCHSIFSDAFFASTLLSVGVVVVATDSHAKTEQIEPSCRLTILPPHATDALCVWVLASVNCVN